MSLPGTKACLMLVLLALATVACSTPGCEITFEGDDDTDGPAEPCEPDFYCIPYGECFAIGAIVPSYHCADVGDICCYEEPGADGDSDTDSDMDSDTDTDADSDPDSDTDVDAGFDAGWDAAVDGG